jgi:hypothetical protein
MARDVMVNVKTRLYITVLLGWGSRPLEPPS